MGLVGHFLEEAGGGAADGNPPIVAVSSDGQCVVFAQREAVVVLRQESPTDPAVIRSPGDAATAAACLAVSVGVHTRHVVMVGFHSGALRLYASSGEPLVALHMHTSPVVQIAAQTHATFHRRPPGLGAGTAAATPADDSAVLCLHAGGVLGHARCASLHATLAPLLAPEALLRLRQGGAGGRGPLAACWRAFRLGEASGGWLGVASGGQLPPPPLEVEAELKAWGDARSLASGDEELPSLCVTLSDGRSLQLHLVAAATAHVPASGGGGERRGAALASRLGGGALSLFSSFSSPAHSAAAPASRASSLSSVSQRLHTEAFLCGETEPVRWFRDGSRRFEALWPDPRRRFVAATDSLGRVMLLEPRTLVVLRVWKGYRDAQCAWLDARDGAGALLAIHAPRRELLELWALV